MQNRIVIDSNKALSESELNIIKNIIETKLSLENSIIEQEINEKLIGGIIVRINDYVIVLSNEQIDTKNSNSRFIIQSARALDDNEKSSIVAYANTKFPESVDYKAEFAINDSISGGISIIFRDEEIDMTLDNLLEEIFSKI